jgi:hypothetical protein
VAFGRRNEEPKIREMISNSGAPETEGVTRSREGREEERHSRKRRGPEAIPFLIS